MLLKQVKTDNSLVTQFCDLFTFLVNIHRNYLEFLLMMVGHYPQCGHLLFFLNMFSTNNALTNKYCSSFKDF
jgi:hypothetical protein